MLETTGKHFDAKVETEVLNAIPMNFDCMVIALTHLTEKSFFSPDNRRHFEVIQGLLKRNVEISRLNIEAEYKRNGWNIPSYFKTVTAPEVNDIKVKVEMLKNYTILRSVRNEMREAIEKLDIWNFKTLGSGSVSKIMALITAHGNEIVSEYLVKNKLLNELKAKKQRKIIKTGYWKIDDMLGGFGEGNVITIAGRPAMGKTMVAGQFALNNKKAGHNVGILSLEMSNEEIYERFMANELNIPYGSIRARDVDQAQIDAYRATVDESVFFIKNQNVKIDQLEPLINILVKIHGCDIVYIDHLEKLYDHDSHFKKHERLGYMMDRLKTTAQNLNIPIVVMQQINRDVEENKGSRPMLSDIKSSGSVEEWSDIVLLLHRPEYYDREPNPENHGLFEINVAKNRFGKTGTVRMEYDPQFMRLTQRY